jgi:hypothetical protein
MDIRKISIGFDLKSNALHYIVGQKVLDGSNEIYLIKRNSDTQSIMIYIINDKSENMPMSVEFNINF